MPLISRHGDSFVDQIARETFELFPNCYRCGQPVVRFEDADVRVLVMRVVHRGHCPPTPRAEPPAAPPPVP